MVRRSAERNLSYLRDNVLSELEVDVSVILDASDPESLSLRLTDLTGPDVERCRQLAQAALQRGYEGLLVPSAAMHGTNLVLLPSNLPDPLSMKVIGSRPLPIELINGEHP